MHFLSSAAVRYVVDFIIVRCMIVGLIDLQNIAELSTCVIDTGARDLAVLRYIFWKFYFLWFVLKFRKPTI